MKDEENMNTSTEMEKDSKDRQTGRQADNRGESMKERKQERIRGMDAPREPQCERAIMSFSAAEMASRRNENTDGVNG